MSVIGFRHTGVVVQDMAAMLHFYQDLLGMEVWADFVDSSECVQEVTAIPGAEIHMVKLSVPGNPGGISIELLHYRSHPQPVVTTKKACDTGINHFALQVDDLDALYQKLSAKGITFHCPPRVSGGAKVTYCRDPEGGIVELVEILEEKS